jgi:hypothetical protein
MYVCVDRGRLVHQRTSGGLMRGTKFVGRLCANYLLKEDCAMDLTTFI